MALISVQVPPKTKRLPLVIQGVLPEAAGALRRAEDESLTLVAAATDESPTVAAAATSDTGDQPDWYWFLAAFLLIGAGIWFGTQLLGTPAPITALAGISVFAAFYVLAQALERLAEFITYIPFIGAHIGATKANTHWETKEKAVTARDTAIAETMKALAQGSDADEKDAANAHRSSTNNTSISPSDAKMQEAGKVQQNVQQAANAHQWVNKVRTNRAVFFWALNSCLASIGCGWLKLSFLATIGVLTGPAWVHIAITGLVVGGGTKPLHDLITNIEKAKEAKEDQAKTNP